MNEIIIIRQIATMTASTIATYTDIKKGYIYDWTTYPLIAIGLLLNIIQQEYNGILIGLIVFIIGWLIYNSGKLGGGDVKLYTGIAITMPFYQNNIFIVQVILFSALAGLAYISSYYTIKYVKKGIDLELNKEGIKKSAIMMSITIAYFILVTSIGNANRGFIIATAIPLITGIIFLALEKGIKKEFFLKRIKLEEAEDDEIIAIEFMDKKEIEKIGKNLKPLMQKKEILKLNKEGINEILVYRDLPRFAPFILIGVIVALAFPQVL